MKKWYIIVIVFLLFYLVVLSDKIEHLKKNKFLTRVKRFIHYIAWFLVIYYSAIFIYWGIKNIF